MNRGSSKLGFTFIEVLVAMAIFTLAVVYFVALVQGSVRATKEAKEISVATWLLQNVITQLETRIETEGFDKGCEKKREAKFEAPYDKYVWRTTCLEIDFSLSQTAAKMLQTKDGESEDTSEDQIQKLILQTASDYLTKSLRELHAEVQWMDGPNKRKVDVTTHFARYDLPVALPGAGAPAAQGGTTSPGAGGTNP